MEGGRSILYVGEDAHISSALDNEAAGFALASAETLDKALDYLVGHAVDCIVTDGAGNIDGLDLLHELRQRDPDIPVVLISDDTLQIPEGALDATVVTENGGDSEEPYGDLPARVHKVIDDAGRTTDASDLSVGSFVDNLPGMTSSSA